MESEIDQLKRDVEQLQRECDKLKSIIDASRRQYNNLVAETKKQVADAKAAEAHANELVEAANGRVKFWEHQGKMANELAERTRKDFQVLQQKQDRLLKEKYFGADSKLPKE